MKKTITLLFALLFIVTGCTANYNIKIGNEIIEEITDLVQDNSINWNEQTQLFWGYSIEEFLDRDYNEYTGSMINQSEDYYTFEKVDGVEYYKKEKILEKNQIGIKYTYDFSRENYSLSKLANVCYNSIDIENDSQTQSMSISTSSSFNCFDMYEFLDEVIINVTTTWDYKVVSSNADKYKNGKYIWIITKENAYNKPIKIEIKKAFNWRLLLIIVIPIIVISFITFLIMKRKIARSNEI